MSEQLDLLSYPHVPFVKGSDTSMAAANSIEPQYPDRPGYAYLDKSRVTLTRERLLEHFHYDPLTGIFTRIKRLGRNGTLGVPVGAKNGQGYITLSFENRFYRCHWLAWLYVHGRWPTHEIDHINGDRMDNRIANLREATRSQNMANAKRQKNNKSGFKGVWFSKYHQTWRAQINKDKKHYHLGTFATAEEASRAYEAAAVRLFGEFARGGS